MGTFGSSLNPETKIPVDVGSTSSSVYTINAGTEEVSFSKSGADLNSAVGASSDIDGDPQWTNFVSISGAGRIESEDEILELASGAGESSGHALRGQVVLDGVAVFDLKLTADGSTAGLAKTVSGVSQTLALEFSESLVIRVARDALVNDGSSTYVSGTINRIYYL